MNSCKMFVLCLSLFLLGMADSVRAEQAWTDGGVAGAVAKYSATASTITASSLYDSGDLLTTASSMTVAGQIVIGSTMSSLGSAAPLVINTNGKYVEEGIALTIRHLYDSSHGILVDIMNGTGLAANLNGTSIENIGLVVWAHNGTGIRVDAGNNSNPQAYFYAHVNPQLGGTNPVFIAKHYTNYFTSDVFKAKWA